MRILGYILVMSIACLQANASADTIRVDNGVHTNANTARLNWEESVILSPAGPCRVEKVLIYYVGGTGTDTVRLTGDASEGAIPPTQYAFSYNTLWKGVVQVTSPGWVEIDVADQNIVLGGYDRIVVQHLMRPLGPVFAQDDAQQTVTSFVYDPITPNPNFFQIPGIYYAASGDYLVRLVVTRLGVSRPPPAFADVTTSAGLADPSGAPLRADMCSVADIDGDGWDDIVVGGGRAFRNKGDGTFEPKVVPFGGYGTVWADVDNDGDMDCFSVAGFSNDKFWRNQGGWSFTDITASTRFTNDAPTVTAMFLDIDHDGDLDLFVANGRSEVNGQEVYFQDKLWRNDNMVFVDVTAPSNIALGEPSPFYDTWGASICDVNNDGWTDIFVATYRLAPDRLYLNQRDGTFKEISVASGVVGIPTAVPTYFGHGMGSDWADVNNDGLVDLAVGNLGHADSRAQYSNPSIVWVQTPSQAPVFTPRTQGSGGVKFFEFNAGMCFADFDQDGFQDLWHGQISYDAFGAGATRRSRLYMNSGGRSFEDVTWDVGMSIHGAWTGVRIDFDGDGDVDLLCASGTESVKLYRNDMQKKGASLSLSLHNAMERSTPLRGEGSRIRVHAAQRTFDRWIVATPISGRSAQMSASTFVGLGDVQTLDSVEVFWADGFRQRFVGLAPNERYVLDRNGSFTRRSTTPQLRLPVNSSVGHPSNIVLRWAKSTQNVDVDVSASQEFSDFVRSERNIIVDSLSLSQLVAGTTYYWRVRFSDGSSWSAPWAFTVGTPAPLPIRLVKPVHQSTGIATTAVLHWRPATYATQCDGVPLYTVQVSDNESFTSELRTMENIVDTTVSVDGLRPEQRYFWRVRGNNGQQAGTWSVAWTFTCYGRPPAITLVLPEDGATNVSQRPRLQWTSHPWVETYSVELDTTPDFNTPLLRDRPDTSFQITSLRKPQTTYFWRVTGKNLVGTSASADVRTFVTGGTVHVHIDDIPMGADSRWVAFDLAGRLLADGPPHTVRPVISTMPGLIIVETYDHRGVRGNVFAVKR